MKLAFAHHTRRLGSGARRPGQVGISGAAAAIAAQTERLADNYRYLGPVAHIPSPLAVPRMLARTFGPTGAGPRYYYWAEPSLCRNYGRQFTAKLRLAGGVDAVVAKEVKHIAAIGTAAHKVLWTDAMHVSLLNFYTCFTDLDDVTIANLCVMDRLAAENCRLLIFASHWAAAEAQRHYGVPDDRLAVIPFGPLVNLPPSPQTVEDLIAARLARRDVCRLLFVGVEWLRKGGRLAVRTARLLEAAGIPARLTVAGIPRLPAELPANVESVGVMDISTTVGAERLAELYRDSHFLLVPTRADCFGHIYTEASEFALPSIATAVGGVPSAVREGRNGVLLPLDAPPSSYCDCIRNLWNDPEAYAQLCRSSYTEYQRELNWQSAGDTLGKLLSAIVRG